MTIKDSKDWNRVTARQIRYSSYTLTELLVWIKENVPEGTKDEDILLDFQIDQYTDYSLDGEKFEGVDAELELSVRKE